MDELVYATVHFLRKAAGEQVPEQVMRDNPLDNRSLAVLNLARQLAALIGRNESTVYWGQFGNRNRQGLFPVAVGRYVREPGEPQFLDVARVAMDELAEAITDVNFATGGYLFFAHYLAGGTPYLLVAMVKERGGIRFTADLEPEEVVEIDLSKLHQAARINLTRYLAELDRNEGPADDDRERTYLCFVNKRGRDEVATYFVDALGCERGLSSARTTKAVVNAVKAYFTSKPEVAQKASAARRAVIELMAARPDQSVITLDEIVGVLVSVLDPGQIEHIPDLKQVLNSERNSIPESFAISAAALKQYAKIKATGPHWVLTFETAALGVHDGAVIYNADERSITLSQVSDETVAKVERLLNER